MFLRSTQSRESATESGRAPAGNARLLRPGLRSVWQRGGRFERPRVRVHALPCGQHAPRSAPPAALRLRFRYSRTRVRSVPVLGAPCWAPPPAARSGLRGGRFGAVNAYGRGSSTRTSAHWHPQQRRHTPRTRFWYDTADRCQTPASIRCGRPPVKSELDRSLPGTSRQGSQVASSARPWLKPVAEVTRGPCPARLLDAYRFYGPLAVWM
jgi:hypothetical protein